MIYNHIVIDERSEKMEEVKFDSPMHVHCYKHNRSLHRVWDKINFYDEIDGNVILANTRAMVTESDGRRWFAKEPAITIFMKDRWFNVICMLRNNGVHFYCNISSPFLKDGNVLTYIDYDLDVIRTSTGDIKVLDENEYALHKMVMNYPSDLQEVLIKELNVVKDLAKRGAFPFDSAKIIEFYNDYLSKTHTGDNYENKNK